MMARAATISAILSRSCKGYCMLLWFVIAYWIISVGIGLYAATRVHNTRDFAIAGRSLPLYIVTATVFATWFGSETVLGIPATFLREGLGGVIADPFGSSICLILVGLFFARPLYRMQLLTIGASTVLIYTMWGGMWSVAITDFIQMIIIVIGMLYIGWDVSQLAGGVT